jgi:hypothetical protein
VARVAGRAGHSPTTGSRAAHGRASGYLDLAQLSFGAPGPEAVDPLPYVLPGYWGTFAAAGARALVLSGPMADDATGRRLLGLLPGTDPVVVRLHASDATIAERIALRVEGGATELPGDPLRHRDDATRETATKAALAEAARLEAEGVGDLRVETDGLEPAEVAARIRDAISR